MEGQEYPHGGPSGGGGRPYVPHDPLQSRILNTQSLEDLTNLILLEQFEFNLVHCSTAFNKFGTFRKDKQRLTNREQGALRALLDMARDKEFLSRQASNICRAIAIGALQEENPQALNLFETLINQESFSTWKPMEISHTLEAYALLTVNNDLFMSKISQELAERSLSNFNAQDIATILDSLSNIDYDTSAVMDAFCRELSSRDLRVEMKDRKRGELDSNIFTLQRLVELVCSFAKAKYRPDDALLEKLILEISTRPLKHLKCSEGANLAWACMEFNYFPKALYERLLPEIDMKRTRYSFHQLAVLARAFAQFPVETDIVKRVFDTLSKEMKTRRERDQPSEVLITSVWAMARARFSAQMLFVKIANEFSQHRSVDTLSNAQLAQLAWAFGRSQFKHSDLYEVIAKSFASRDLSTMKTSEIIATAWALSSMNSPQLTSFLGQVEKEIATSRGLNALSNLELSEFIWSLAHAGHVVSDATFDAVESEIDTRGIFSFKPYELCSILYAFGRFGWNDTKLFESVSDSLVGQSLDNFTFHDLANLVYAFACLGFYHRALFDRVASVCVYKASESVMSSSSSSSTATTTTIPSIGPSASDLIVIAWSFACNQSLYSSYSRSFFEISFGQAAVPASERTPKNAQLLNETIVAWKQTHPNEATPLPALLEKLSAENWVANVLNSASTSNPKSEIKSDVSKALQDSGFVHMVDDFKASNGLTASVRLTSNVLVEIENTEGEFVLADETSLRGQVAFKLRLLENSGFWVVVVLAKEWNKIVSSSGTGSAEELENAKVEFFQQKFKSLI